MRPEFKRLHYILAGVAFFAAFLTYLMTMQPTIPFWDCGEFAAAAIALQVPHPPGAPLWTIVGRIAMLLPTFSDPAARYNLFSVISSALSIFLLYLTLVRLLRLWRGYPQNVSDAIITFGGALVGALAYTWTDSFWFNALECEVYAFGSLFISLVPWLLLVWYDHADEPHNERYLLLIAYVIGVSLGVHQLALLTMFPAFMLVYYRHRDNVTMGSWLGMVGLSVVAFIIVYIVILSKLVEWSGNGKGILAAAVIVALIAAIVYGERKKKPVFAISGWMLMMVFLGYTTYMFVMVRAAQDPPMNENAPSTFKKLAGYINRDQYGSMSFSDEFAHRRLESQKADHPTTWDDYSSDGDFFWRYQTNFMFHRYLGWNFIGRSTDEQGAGVDPLKTWGLPFLLGLFGIYWHFKRDPKRALSLIATFIIMGYLTVWYQNQQDPQPRERDYFYVGAFYVFAMWVGIGAVGLMEMLKEKLAERSPGKLQPALLGSLALIVIFIPINQCIGLAGLISGEPFSKSSKWAEYSRRHNWVPWEYAYNILQSCEPNAILFTYGDNDTFPLWCLQDAYHIRRDVRIVQLQLATMMWNVKQLKKDNDWGAKAVKLTTFTDSLLNFPDDDVYRTLNWNPSPIDLPVSVETARWITGDSTVNSTVFAWLPKFIIPSDQVVLDIIRNNLADRPIYYSATVPENSRANLNKYLVYEGLTARVTPFEQPPDQTGLGGSIQYARYAETTFRPPFSQHEDPHRGLILYTYSDPTAHRSAMDDQYSLGYRYMFIRLANGYLGKNDLANARRALDTMEARIPIGRVGLDYPFASMIADLADKAGDWPLTQKYAKAGAEALSSAMQNPDWRETDRYASQINPDYELANLEMRAGQFEQALQKFTVLRSQAKGGQQTLFQLKMDEVTARKLEAMKSYDSAKQKFQEILNVYESSGPGQAGDLQDLKNHMAFDSIQAHLK